MLIKPLKLLLNLKISTKLLKFLAIKTNVPATTALVQTGRQAQIILHLRDLKTLTLAVALAAISIALQA